MSSSKLKLNELEVKSFIINSELMLGGGRTSRPSGDNNRGNCRSRTTTHSDGANCGAPGEGHSQNFPPHHDSHPTHEDCYPTGDISAYGNNGCR